MTFDVDGYGVAEFAYTDGKYASERRSRSNMPSSYAHKKMADFRWDLYSSDTGAAKETAELFASSYETWRRQGRGLYIWSNAKGSGKTMLACALANEAIDRHGAVVKFIGAADYVRLVARKDPDAAQEAKSIQRCGLLVFDDIGTEDGKKEWIAEAVYRLVNHRYSENLPTIYTSNNDFLHSHGNDRIHSRIYGASVELRLPDDRIREALAARSQKRFLDELKASQGAENRQGGEGR